MSMKLKTKAMDTSKEEASHDEADHMMDSGAAAEALSSGSASDAESDDDSDDSDAGGAADLAPEVAQQLMDLESQLESNPAYMDTHLQVGRAHKRIAGHCWNNPRHAMSNLSEGALSTI